MEEELKKESRKQYFKYFRFWFIAIGILLLITAALAVCRYVIRTDAKTEIVRANYESDAGRVFDGADVLTDSQESELYNFIKEKEDEYHFDIVVVTISQDVEAEGSWETVMRDLADDIYDNGNYGYDKIHGDGILLLDNWYRDERGSQAGTWLSTCGGVYEKFGNYDIDRVLDQVDYYIESDPLKAYRKAIEKAGQIYLGEDSDSTADFFIPVPFILFVSLLVSVIYGYSKIHQVPAKDTTTLMQYVEGGKERYNVRTDKFVRKNVTSVKIETSSSGGGGGSRSSGGHGGGHVSSGGVSHGGGGHRR